MRSYIIRKFDPLHDLRYASLSAEAERAYNRLYLLAGILDADGLFIEHGRMLTTEEIAYRIRLQTPLVVKSIKELEKARLIHSNGKGPQILDWKKEQIDLNVKREKDRERQQRHRGVTRDEDVTARDEPLSQSVTSIERETQTQIKTLLSLLSEHRDFLEKNPAWITDAIKIAKANGKQSDKYIAGILKNWILEGRTQKGAMKKNANPQPGAQKRTDKPQPAQANYSAADRAAAERALAKRGAKTNV